MKIKLITLIIVQTLFLSALSAQTTQEQADAIVLERLSRETQPYIVYAKEGVQEEMIITSSDGELLELDYACWVYYIQYAEGGEQGRYLIVNESNGNLLEVNAKSDAEPENLAEWRMIEIPITLQGTKWKLAGIVEVQTGEMKELEPKKCSECYTFTFDTDSTAVGQTVSNDLFVWLRPVLSVASYSKAGELGDGYLFLNIIKTIISYELNKNELKFYYDDGKNYLLFKQIGS